MLHILRAQWLESSLEARLKWATLPAKILAVVMLYLIILGLVPIMAAGFAVDDLIPSLPQYWDVVIFITTFIGTPGLYIWACYRLAGKDTGKTYDNLVQSSVVLGIGYAIFLIQQSGLMYSLEGIFGMSIIHLIAFGLYRIYRCMERLWTQRPQ